MNAAKRLERFATQIHVPKRGARFARPPQRVTEKGRERAKRSDARSVSRVGDVLPNFAILGKAI